MAMVEFRYRTSLTARSKAQVQEALTGEEAFQLAMSMYDLTETRHIHDLQTDTKVPPATSPPQVFTTLALVDSEQ